MRAVIFSSDGRRIAAEADRARDRSVEVWYVATTGHSAAHSASSERLGVAGSRRGRTAEPTPPSPPPGRDPPPPGGRAGPGGRPPARRDPSPAERLEGPGPARPAGTTYGGRSSL